MSDDKQQPLQVKVKADVDHGSDMGCLGLLIVVAAVLLGASIESSAGKIADAVNRYTDKVVATQPARTAP